jgi:hypothetical protein
MEDVHKALKDYEETQDPLFLCLAVTLLGKLIAEHHI